MGVCASTASDGKGGKKSKRGLRKKQRSESSLLDPADVKVAHITPRISADYDPSDPAAAAQPPACEAGCQCCYEPDEKEPSTSGAVLSAMIVIESPAPDNRQLLLQAADAEGGAEGRAASSSHSADAAPTSASILASDAVDSPAVRALTPDSTIPSAALPHSVASLPASPLAPAAVAIPAHTRSDSLFHHHGSLAALSAAASPHTTPAHSRSPSIVAAACPVHARNPSLSIMQVLRESNSAAHSRNPSVILTNEHVFKLQEETKEEVAEAGAVDDRWKSAVIDVSRGRIDTVDKMACSI